MNLSKFPDISIVPALAQHAVALAEPLHAFGAL
jgi:hypothetical protein